MCIPELTSHAAAKNRQLRSLIKRKLLCHEETVALPYLVNQVSQCDLLAEHNPIPVSSILCPARGFAIKVVILILAHAASGCGAEMNFGATVLHAREVSFFFGVILIFSLLRISFVFVRAKARAMARTSAHVSGVFTKERDKI
jgi:hypothetical protein